MGVDAVPEGSQSVRDYLLEPVEGTEELKEEAKAEKKPDNEKEASKRSSSLVIFAVDISGSMSSTTTVPDLQGELGPLKV